MPLKAEEEIDIWSKKEKNQNIEQIQNQNKKSEQKLNFEAINKPKKNEIEIQSEISLSEKDEKLFGIYDPAENDFDLNMWSQSSAENVRSSFARIKKLIYQMHQWNYSKIQFFLMHTLLQIWMIKNLLN